MIWESGVGLTRRDVLTRLTALALSLKGASALAQSEPAHVGAVARWNESFEMTLDVEIAQPGGSRARRPYVAVWMEDREGNSVRTLALWANTGRGRRWLPDLRRWVRAERDRQGRSGGDLTTTASSATRTPGRYTLTWNGRDDSDRPVEQGQYFLCVEAAREHGTYQLVREPYAFASRAFKATPPGNAEIASLALDFHEKK